jgi:hypothetical protein
LRQSATKAGGSALFLTGSENVFEFSAAEKIDEFRIFVQTRRERDADYQLKRVVEISKGHAISGESRARLFSCARWARSR